MSLAADLRARLRLPVMAGPMFIASTADLVIAQCRAGIIGAMPALNPRSTAALDEDVARIREAVGEAPYCINLVAHRSNDRLDADLDVILRHKVPIVVLALAANADLVKTLQANGALVFQDVIKDRHARKCAEMGGWHHRGRRGRGRPYRRALAVRADAGIRSWWDGLLILSGCIATGRSVLAAEVLGADLAYIGSAFLASSEANTQHRFKQMIVDGSAKDIAATNCFTGVNANFLIPSILENGLDPAKLVRTAGAEVSIAGGGANSRAWREIWSAGQGIGAITRSEPAADYTDWLAADYARARAAMGMG